MSEETEHYKNPMLFAEDVFIIQSALLIAIDYFRCEGMYGYAEKCGDQLTHLIKSSWKELPTPNTLNK
jgi:hypothetical protein